MKKHLTPTKLSLAAALFLWLTVLVMQYPGSETALLMATIPAALTFVFMAGATATLIRRNRAENHAGIAFSAGI